MGFATMKSTIQHALQEQQRDGLTNEALAGLNVCRASGEPHDWMLVTWERHTEAQPIWSAYGPVDYVVGPTTTSAQMRCFCGAQLNFSQDHQ
jgi:hypothetical protein